MRNRSAMTSAILGGLLILTGLPVFGETPEESLERGRKLLHQGQRMEGMKVLSRAVEGFRASLSKNPADARTQFLMGKAFFYMDGYYAGGEHRTFAFFKNEPEYDLVREKVVLILQGKLRAQSGMKPGKKE